MEKGYRKRDMCQLDLRVGEVVCVQRKDDDGWWGGCKHDDPHTTGWFPAHCVGRPNWYASRRTKKVSHDGLSSITTCSERNSLLESSLSSYDMFDDGSRTVRRSTAPDIIQLKEFLEQERYLNAQERKRSVIVWKNLKANCRPSKMS